LGGGKGSQGENLLIKKCSQRGVLYRNGRKMKENGWELSENENIASL
jgi:hypothetical protein